MRNRLHTSLQKTCNRASDFEFDGNFLTETVKNLDFSHDMSDERNNGAVLMPLITHILNFIKQYVY